MKITVQLTADDYIQANRLAMRPRPSLRYVGYVVSALFVAVTVWQVYEIITGKAPLGTFVAIVGAVSYLLVLYFVFMPRRIKRLFKQQKTLSALHEIECTDTHFIANSEHGTFKMAWPDFHKWKKNQNLILVYQSAALMHMLPLRAFDSHASVAELESILEKHLGPQKA